MNYELLLSPFFSTFQGQKKILFLKKIHIVASALKSSIIFLLESKSVFLGLAVLVILVIVVKGVCPRLLSLLFLHRIGFAHPMA